MWHFRGLLWLFLTWQTLLRSVLSGMGRVSGFYKIVCSKVRFLKTSISRNYPLHLMPNLVNNFKKIDQYSLSVTSSDIYHWWIFFNISSTFSFTHSAQILQINIRELVVSGIYWCVFEGHGSDITVGILLTISVDKLLDHIRKYCDNLFHLRAHFYCRKLCHVIVEKAGYVKVPHFYGHPEKLTLRQVGGGKYLCKETSFGGDEVLGSINCI